MDQSALPSSPSHSLTSPGSAALLFSSIDITMVLLYLYFSMYFHSCLRCPQGMLKPVTRTFISSPWRNWLPPPRSPPTLKDERYSAGTWAGPRLPLRAPALLHLLLLAFFLPFISTSQAVKHERRISPPSVFWALLSDLEFSHTPPCSEALGHKNLPPLPPGFQGLCCKGAS